MKILHVTSGFLPESTGGTELHAYHLARTQRDRFGHDVAVFTRTPARDRDDYDLIRDEHDGILVSRVAYDFGDASSFSWIYSNPRMEEIFRRELDSVRPDLVHIHHLTCLSTGLIDVAKDLGYPVVMTLHDFWMVCPRGQRIDRDLTVCESIDRVKCHACLGDLWPHFFPDAPPFDGQGWRSRMAETPDVLATWDAHVRRVLDRVDVLITPSAFHRARFLEFGLSPDRVEAIPHGLDHGLLRHERDPDAPIRRIAFIGTVIPSKGVHILIDAFQRLGRADLILDIHGEAPSFHGDTGYLSRLKASIHPGANICFHGGYRHENLPEILRRSDVLVVPSIWWESFCLTIREGLLSGLIVVASGHGAMAEALDGERNGLPFEPANPADLAAKLDMLLSSPDLRRRYRNLGDRVKTLEASTEETLDRYRTALDRAGRRPAASPEVTMRAVSGDGPRVTVFIPTYNGGPLFDRVLRRVFDQRVSYDYEVFVIDSGSTDETLDILARHPVRVKRIPNSEFNHGLTRNRGVREARGEIVALLTQDAVPYDENWLNSLVSNFDDPRVAGAYCRQIPREDCNPFQRDRLEGWTDEDTTPVIKHLPDRSDWDAMEPMERYRLIAFDDVASCVRKSVMEKIPFRKRQFGEDVTWAREAILAGYKIVMDPGAVVVHSHNNSAWYEFKRVYLDHQNLNDLVGMHLVPRFSDVLRFTWNGTRHLGGVVRRVDIPLHEKIFWWMKTPLYSFGQNLGQFLGARSNLARREGIYGIIDRFLKKGV